jgi:hypothetical protein
MGFGRFNDDDGLACAILDVAQACPTIVSKETCIWIAIGQLGGPNAYTSNADIYREERFTIH